eukprot:236188-Pyramimonas_sp.AAC.1
MHSASVPPIIEWFWSVVFHRLENANFAEWTIAPASRLPPSWRRFVWTVPDNIVSRIPGCVVDLLKLGGRPLVVIRNLDFVDACAARARTAKWAMAGGLKRAAIDV